MANNLLSNHHSYHQVLLRNFKSVGKPSVFTFESGLTVVKGYNGHGKSIIFDGLFFALYGSTLSNTRDAKVNIDNIVNSIADGNLISMVTFEINRHGVKTEYLKVMGRKPAVVALVKLKEKIDLNDIINDIPLNTKMETYLQTLGEIVTLDVDKTKSQAKFESEYMRIDADMFKSTRLATLDHMDFLSQSDKYRSNAILEIFDANWIETLAAEKKVARKDLKANVETLKTELAAVDYEVKQSEINLETMREQKEKDDLLIAELEEQMNSVQKEISELTKQEMELVAREEECDAYLNRKTKTIELNKQIETLTINNKALETSAHALYENNKQNYLNMIEADKAAIDNLIKNKIITNIDGLIAKESEIKSKMDELYSIHNKINTLKNNKITLEKSLEDAIKDKDQHMDHNSKSLDAYNKEIETNNSIYNDANDKHCELIDKLNELAYDEEDTREGIESNNNKIAKLNAKIEHEKEFLNFYNQKCDNDECPTCRQSINDDVKAGLISKCHAIIYDAEVKLSAHKYGLELFKQAKDDYEKITSDIDAVKRQIQNAKDKVAMNQTQLDALKITCDYQIAGDDEKIAKIKNAIKDNDEQLSQYDGQDKDQLKIGIDRLTVARDEVRDAINSHNDAIRDKGLFEKNIADHEELLSHLEVVMPQEHYNNTKDILKYQGQLKDNVYTEEEIAKVNANKASASLALISVENLKQHKIENYYDIKGRKEGIYNIDIDKYICILRDLKEKYNICINNYELAYKQYKINENIINIFSNNSMRSILFSKHVEIINQYVNILVERLNLPFQVKFNNDFSVDVSGYGFGSTYGTFSGGQKHIVCVIVFAVLKDLIISMGKYSSNIVIFDEYLDRGLDVMNTNMLLELIQFIYKDENIMLITHKDFEGAVFDRVYKATKDIYTKWSLDG